MMNLSNVCMFFIEYLIKILLFLENRHIITIRKLVNLVLNFVTDLFTFYFLCIYFGINHKFIFQTFLNHYYI